MNGLIIILVGGCPDEVILNRKPSSEAKPLGWTWISGPIGSKQHMSMKWTKFTPSIRVTFRGRRTSSWRLDLIDWCGNHTTSERDASINKFKDSKTWQSSKRFLVWTDKDRKKQLSLAEHHGRTQDRLSSFKRKLGGSHVGRSAQLEQRLDSVRKLPTYNLWNLSRI